MHLKAHKVGQQECFSLKFFLQLFDDQFSQNVHRFVAYFMHVGIQRVRTLVLDINLVCLLSTVSPTKVVGNSHES